MNQLHIMSVVGSAVPRSFRARGLLACWYLMLDGEPVSGPLDSLDAARELSAELQKHHLNS